MMFKHHASRFFSLAILALLIAGCSSTVEVVGNEQIQPYGYAFTMTSDEDVVAERAYKLSNGDLVVQSELSAAQLSTLQQNTPAGDLEGDISQSQLVLSNYAPTINDAPDGANGAPPNGNPDRFLIVDTNWRNDTTFFLRRGSFGNVFAFRLVDCYVVTAGASSGSSNGDACTFVDIPPIGNEDLGNDSELDPSEVMPPGSGTFGFATQFENTDRIRFFVVANIPAILVCTTSVDTDPSGSSCGNDLNP